MRKPARTIPAQHNAANYNSPINADPRNESCGCAADTKFDAPKAQEEAMTKLGYLIKADSCTAILIESKEGKFKLDELQGYVERIQVK